MHLPLCPQSVFTCFSWLSQQTALRKPPLHTIKAKLRVPYFYGHDAAPMPDRLQTFRGKATSSAGVLGHLQPLEYTTPSRNAENEIPTDSVSHRIRTQYSDTTLLEPQNTQDALFPVKLVRIPFHPRPFRLCFPTTINHHRISELGCTG